MFYVGDKRHFGGSAP